MAEQPEKPTPHQIAGCIRQAQALMHKELASMAATVLDTYPPVNPEERQRAHAHFMDILLAYHSRLERCVTIPFAVWLAEAQQPSEEEKEQG